MIIWFIWRTNVGKSSLFNRLIWTHRAIITDISWTTRELLVEKWTLAWRNVTYIDSPWLDTFEEEIPFINEIIEQADVLVFVTDWKRELWDHEYRIHKMIIESWKMQQTVLVVNKCDGKVYNGKAELILADFYQLWYEYTFPCSAEQAEWLEELVDGILEIAKSKQLIWPAEKKEEKLESLPIAIIWRPNVWKSTLLNKLVWQDLSHVQDEPWTTLDYIYANFEWNWKNFTLYDTAWIRRRKKIAGIEKIAYAKTMSMIDYTTPVIVFVLDMDEWMTHRDKSLLGEIIHKWVPLVIALNKIDNYSKDEVQRMIRQMPLQKSFWWIPYIPISAKEWIWLPQLMTKIEHVYASSLHHISTAELNKKIQRSWILSPPTFPKNKICKRKYITQIGEFPPTFMISVNNKEYANFSFKRWLESAIRNVFPFEWNTIKLKMSSKVDTNPYLEK